MIALLSIVDEPFEFQNTSREFSLPSSKKILGTTNKSLGKSKKMTIILCCCNVNGYFLNPELFYQLQELFKLYATYSR